MSGVGALSYAAGAAASLALAIVLAIGWRGRLAGVLLLLAAVVNAAWSALFAYYAWQGLANPWLLDFGDLVRYAAWFAFLLVVSVAGRSRAFGATLVAVALGLCLLQGVFLTLDASPASLAGRSAAADGLALIGAVALPVFGLMLIEQLYRGSNAQGRWAVKYLAIGLGGLFAYDLFVYSDALLLRRIDAQLWDARGIINAIVMPLIAVSAARSPSWSLDVYVSRRAVLHTASLVAAGVYLLAMAAVGYYIRVYGGSWGGAAQAAFLFGAVLVLVMLLFSAQLRAKTRVFFSKHFFNYKYDYREEWLRFTRTLSGDADDRPLKERVIRAIAQLVDSPGGALWQVRDGRFEPMATWHFSIPDEARVREGYHDPLALVLREREWVVSRDEWQTRPERYGRGIDSHWLAGLAQAWLVVPLMYQDQLRGFVVLKHSRANIDLNWEDCDLLKTAGRQAASYLAQEEAAEALSQAQQFEAFSKLSAFVVHDLKNVMNQLSLVVRNADRHKHNPAFIDDAVRTIENALARMSGLMTQLRRGEAAERPEATDLVGMLRRVAQAHEASPPAPQLSTELDELSVLIDSKRFEAVVEHLLQNGKDATGEDGTVELRLANQGDGILLEIIDDGQGMSPEFVRERLFKPFDTTKGSKGMGIGAYEARDFISGLGGSLEVSSKPGAGTRIEIRLPESLITTHGVRTAKEMAR